MVLGNHKVFKEWVEKNQRYIIRESCFILYHYTQWLPSWGCSGGTAAPSKPGTTDSENMKKDQHPSKEMTDCITAKSTVTKTSIVKIIVSTTPVLSIDKVTVAQAPADNIQINMDLSLKSEVTENISFRLLAAASDNMLFRSFGDVQDCARGAPIPEVQSDKTQRRNSKEHSFGICSHVLARESMQAPHIKQRLDAMEAVMCGIL